MFTDTYRSIFKANSTSLFDFQPNQPKISACARQFTMNSGTPQASTDPDRETVPRLLNVLMTWHGLGTGTILLAQSSLHLFVTSTSGT